jgi:hypothetical protein
MDKNGEHFTIVVLVENMSYVRAADCGGRCGCSEKAGWLRVAAEKGFSVLGRNRGSAYSAVLRQRVFVAAV